VLTWDRDSQFVSRTNSGEREVSTSNLPGGEHFVLDFVLGQGEFLPFPCT
jgi:hypothetical protein